MDVGGIKGDRLQSYLRRLLNLEEEKKKLTEDIKAVMEEAKGDGFDSKTVKRLVKYALMSPEEREETELLFQTYARACDMPVVQLDLFDQGDAQKDAAKAEAAEAAEAAAGEAFEEDDPRNIDSRRRA